MVQVGSVTISMRSYFSSQLLWSADHHRQLAQKIEAEHTGESTFDMGHRCYVLASIQASAGFLESLINELFKDAYDVHGVRGDGYLAPLSLDEIKEMGRYWISTKGGFAETFDKYDKLLEIAGHVPLPKGQQPYQDAKLLMALRNEIVHFKPESLTANIPHQLERKLSKKFAPNALVTSVGNPWWPDKCLGAGCAEWAVAAAKSYADAAVDAVGLMPNYRRVEEQAPGTS